MKLKTLILAALSVVLAAAAVLFAIGYHESSQTQANKGLYRACSNGNAAAAAYWLAKGADVNTPDIGFEGIPGKTPLMLCAHLPAAELVELLLELGADPNAVDHAGQPVIHHATDARIANLLVAHGADVNMKDKEGLTALQYRVKNNYIMDDELKAVLEGNGSAAKLREERRRMVKGGEANEASANGK
jgi:hypothetical protein